MSDSQSAHHAGPRIHGIVHRVRADVTASASETDSNDNQVVDVLHIIPNLLFGELRVASSKDEIATGTNAELTRNMARQGEVPITPSNINLSLQLAIRDAGNRTT